MKENREARVENRDCIRLEIDEISLYTNEICLNDLLCSDKIE